MTLQLVSSQPSIHNSYEDLGKVSDPIKPQATSTEKRKRGWKRGMGSRVKPSVVGAEKQPSTPSATMSTTLSHGTLDTLFADNSTSTTNSTSQQKIPSAVEDHSVTDTTSSVSVHHGCLKVKTQEESICKSWETTKAEAKALRGEDEHHAQFHTISVHSHCIRLGDNPSVSIGPPIGIGWKAFESQTVTVDYYEATKPTPRDRQEMLIPLKVRESILIGMGYSRIEMGSASRLANRIRCSRRRSACDGQFKDAIKQVIRSLKCNHQQNLPPLMEITNTNSGVSGVFSDAATEGTADNVSNNGDVERAKLSC